MALLKRSLGAKPLVLLVLIPMLILSACGGGSTGSSTGTTPVPTKVPITVGSKLDLDVHLLGEMYVLLLKKAGYTVNSKLALGDNATLELTVRSEDTRLNSSHTEISTLSLHDALPIYPVSMWWWFHWKFNWHYACANKGTDNSREQARSRCPSTW